MINYNIFKNILKIYIYPLTLLAVAWYCSVGTQGPWGTDTCLYLLLALGSE